jgi:hypothetical protein
MVHSQQCERYASLANSTTSHACSFYYYAFYSALLMYVMHCNFSPALARPSLGQTIPHWPLCRLCVI